MEKPFAQPRQFRIQTSDNFNFNTYWGYSFFFGSSYHFRLTNQRYMELGVLYHFSPVNTNALQATLTVNGRSFSATFQPQRFSYFQIFLSYSLNRLTFNRYL